LYDEARAAAAAERAARVAAERSQDRLTFLAEASSTLASSVLDLETTLAHVVDLAVPRLADGCAIQLVDERGAPLPVALSHADPAKLAGLRRVVDERAGGEGQSVWVLPLHSQSRKVGELTLVTEPGRALDGGDLQLAEQLAVRAGTAIENARLFADRSRVARSLQSSLLPPSLPSIPGLELGARYAPAGEGVEVGGDFYDAFAMDDGRWLLVVGDVRGKGVDAAAVTGLARHTIRSIALSESRPSAILSHLNRVLLAAEADRVAALGAFDEPAWELTEPRFCTVAVSTVQPRAGGAAVVVCSGGHPLPLVARAGGCIEAVGRPGSLVGAAPDIELHDVDVDLGPGDSLVCFTDGIVERHHGKEFFEESGIATVLRAAGDADAATLAARIEDEARNVFAGKPHDDMAVLIARVPLT
ncbi:MAG: PP2C family protein-serine/threonine phosphatase, partial [Acidimicrobiales bacterium]